MKKGTVRIDEFVESNGLYTIHINNIGLYPETMQKCIDITKHFAKGDKFFFGHSRIDGVNLTNEKQVQYSKEIPEYFQSKGKYEPLIVYIQKKNRVKNLSGYITVGSLPVSNGTYEMLPKIFHYYLDTIYFCPKIEWSIFVESFRDYMKHGAKDYVFNGFTDFLFAYVDSGDFLISFDKKKYDKDSVYQVIQNILSKNLKVL